MDKLGLKKIKKNNVIGTFLGPDENNAYCRLKHQPLLQKWGLNVGHTILMRLWKQQLW